MEAELQENDIVDSYDELAQEELTEPSKRGRGRPKGAKNKEKVPPPPPPSESEDEELLRQKKKAPTKKSPESEEEAIPPRQKKTNKPEKKSKPPPPDSDEEEPAPPKRKKTINKPKPPPSESEEEPQPPPPPPKPKRKKANFTLDVEFDEPSQKKQTPIRMKRPVAARSLMDVVAEAAHQHGARERDRRRNFYESFLPM